MYIEKSQNGYRIRYGEWGTALNKIFTLKEAKEYYYKNKSEKDSKEPFIYSYNL